MFKSWNILICFTHYSAILFLFCLQLILFQQLNLITLVIFLQQETKVAEWLYFKGNKRSVAWKTKVLLLHCSCVAVSHSIFPCRGVVFSADPKLAKFLNICLVLNLVGQFSGSSLSLQKKKVPKPHWAVSFCVWYAQDRFAELPLDSVVSVALGQVGVRQVVKLLKIM